MLVVLQIIRRLCWKIDYWHCDTNTEGLRENVSKLFFIELSQNTLRLIRKCVENSQLTHLMLMVFYTLFENFGFLCF